MKLDDIPYPLLYETMSYLEPTAVFSMEAVNKKIYGKLSNNPYFL
ncbi:MAG: hypothetical protein V2I33_21130 [Kangiellaceae bacterium]|jgi:hypothetical protein|nr:hypothetical protein [Kangiellaceae bacterium]